MVKDVIDRGDQAFERSYNTQFLMETNWDQEHIRTSTFKPIVLVYIKDDIAEFVVPKLKNLMEKFAGQFEFYFTCQQQKAQKFFPVQDLLGIPYFMIIDNSKKVLLKGNQHMMEKYIPAGSKIDFNQQYDYKKGEIVPKKQSQQDNIDDQKHNQKNNYLKKIPKQILRNPLLADSVIYTSQIYKLQQFEHQVQAFLKKYYGGELFHQVIAPFSKPVSQVKDVNTMILYNQLKSKNNSANQCIVQAYAPSCASCQFNGKVFNGFSRKLKKHGMLKDLPLYRMDSRNVSPIFGRFPYTPMYFYVQYQKIEQDNKRDVVIKRVDKISPIVKFNQFKQDLIAKANLPNDFSEKIKLSPQEQFQSYYMQKDLEQNFDPDFDFHKGQKSEEQYREEKIKNDSNSQKNEGV